uniref:Uncharacterized protein n=1 Tax=Oryza brachyantha TaxID=4533 RepID=J3LV34_ORYBR
MAAASSAGEVDTNAGDWLKGSATGGVTELSGRDEQWSTRGDSTSCAAFLSDAPAAAAAAIASGTIIFKLLWTLRRSYSLNDGRNPAKPRPQD